MEEGDFLSEARVRGELWRVDWYPGVILRGDGEVVGEVWEVPEKMVTELDKYEGKEYRRVKVKVKVKMEVAGVDELNELDDVWIYEWVGDPEGLMRVESGDWMEEEGS